MLMSCARTRMDRRGKALGWGIWRDQSLQGRQCRAQEELAQQWAQQAWPLTRNSPLRETLTLALILSLSRSLRLRLIVSVNESIDISVGLSLRLSLSPMAIVGLDGEWMGLVDRVLCEGGVARGGPQEVGV